MNCVRKLIPWHLLLLAAIPWQSVSFCGRAYAQEVPPENRHGERIAKLENQSSLSGQQRYRLAGQHMYMGDFYTTLARCAAILNVEAAEFYAEDQVREWGTEYFGALAALELGRIDRATAFAASAGRLRSASPLVVSLCSVLGRVAKSAGSAGNSLSWADLAPSSYYDSLESAYQLSRVGALGPTALDFHRDSVIDGITVSPLLIRWRLAQLVADENVGELRRLLRKFESDSFPLWKIASTVGTAVFSDPPLVGLIAQAHYLVSERDFAQAAGMLTDTKALKSCLTYWVRLCFKNGRVERADSLLKIMSESAIMLPYRGWVAAHAGDDAKAAEHWDKCLKTDDYAVGVELLRLWRSDQSINPNAESLREWLLASMGGLRAQAKMRRSRRGKYQLMKVYSEIGAWFFAREVYDSASYYWGNARVGHDPVSLRNYNAPFCAGYFSARVLSGAPDHRQEGWIGFNDLKNYFPAARSVVEPLLIVLIREDAKLRE